MRVEWIDEWGGKQPQQDKVAGMLPKTPIRVHAGSRSRSSSAAARPRPEADSKLTLYLERVCKDMDYICRWFFPCAFFVYVIAMSILLATSTDVEGPDEAVFSLNVHLGDAANVTE